MEKTDRPLDRDALMALANVELTQEQEDWLLLDNLRTMARKIHTTTGNRPNWMIATAEMRARIGDAIRRCFKTVLLEDGVTEANVNLVTFDGMEILTPEEAAARGIIESVTDQYRRMKNEWSGK